MGNISELAIEIFIGGWAFSVAMVAILFYAFPPDEFLGDAYRLEFGQEIPEGILYWNKVVMVILGPVTLIKILIDITTPPDDNWN